MSLVENRKYEGLCAHVVHVALKYPLHSWGFLVVSERFCGVFVLARLFDVPHALPARFRPRRWRGKF